MESSQIEDGVRTVAMTLQELGDALEQADIIDGGEAISEARIEPGQLVLTIVQ